MNTRIKQKDIKPLRERILKEQDYVCPLCKTKIGSEEACLDHDHETGRIRYALHRSCNQAEGRIVSWAKRSRDSDPYHFIRNLVELHAKDYSCNPIHPSHLSENEKELKRLRKHQRKLKSEAGRANVQVKIDALIRQIEEEQSG